MNAIFSDTHKLTFESQKGYKYPVAMIFVSEKDVSSLEKGFQENVKNYKTYISGQSFGTIKSKLIPPK